MICRILYGRQHDAQADDERVEHEILLMFSILDMLLTSCGEGEIYHFSPISVIEIIKYPTLYCKMI